MARQIRLPLSCNMSEQEVHTSVEQRIIIKFLSREGVKPAATTSEKNILAIREMIERDRRLTI